MDKEKLKKASKYVVMAAIVLAALGAFMSGEKTLEQSLDALLRGLGVADTKVEQPAEAK
jgi:hypothetical protein